MASVNLEREILSTWSDNCVELYKKYQKKSPRFVLEKILDILDPDIVVKEAAAKILFTHIAEMFGGPPRNNELFEVFKTIVLNNQQLFTTLTWMKIQFFELNIQTLEDEKENEDISKTRETLLNEINNISSE